MEFISGKIRDWKPWLLTHPVLSRTLEPMNLTCEKKRQISPLLCDLKDKGKAAGTPCPKPSDSLPQCLKFPYSLLKFTVQKY